MIGKSRLTVALLVLLAGGVLHAENGVIVHPAPGSYSADQLLSITTPPDTRFAVYLDGKRLDESAVPLLLHAGDGEERVFRIQTELRGIKPDSPLLESRIFEWKIDKKSPATPRFTLQPDEGGVRVRVRSDEPVSIQYSVYHPYYKAVSRDTSSGRESIFLPDGAVICAIAVDRAGNRSLPSSVTADTGRYGKKPFVVVNPVSGSWANRQTLVLETVPGTDVVYTIDGTDPAVAGKRYEGPELLDVAGPVTLRVSARGPDGEPWNETVVYTVTEKSSSLEQSVPLTGGLFEAGQFYEATLPEGFSATIGNPWNSGQPQQSLLFTVPEGVRRLYPVTVRNGSVFWRWICAVGAPPSSSPVAPPDGADPLQPKIAIHDWHFLSISHTAPVFYSFDGSSWIRYTEPVILDREKNAVFNWYTPSWDNGQVRTIALPAKPRLSGIPAGGVTANPVFLAVNDSPYTMYYTTGGEFLPNPPEPGVAPVLASGLLLETPNGASESCAVRIRAFHDGMYHGELNARFVLDRKAPRVPSLGIPESLSWSREPVPLRVTGEDMVQVSLVPDNYVHDGRTWLLTGDTQRSVTYTIRSFSVDRAGNRSPVTEKTLTIDRNALYVDSGYRGTKRPDGSPSAPFTDLDSALSMVTGPDPWRILISGSVVLQQPHTLRSSVSLIGTNADIRAGGAAILRTYSNNLSLSGIRLERTSRTSNGRDVSAALPLIEAVNGTLLISDCSIMDTGSLNVPVVRGEKANITLKSARIRNSSSEYGTVVDARNSTLHVRDCHFESVARVVSAVAVSTGRATFLNTDIIVSADRAARAIECWGSQLVISGLRLVRSGTPDDNADTALWMDRKSVVITEKSLDVRGFRYGKKSGE